MRERLLMLAHVALLTLMTVCLPFFWLANHGAKMLRAAHDALEMQLIVARAHRKVLAAVKRRNAP